MITPRLDRGIAELNGKSSSCGIVVFVFVRVSLYVFVFVLVFAFVLQIRDLAPKNLRSLYTLQELN